MRFIINFFLFGFIFFLIWHFFPEAFSTLVSWAQTVFDFFRDLFSNVREKVDTKHGEPAAALLSYMMLKNWIKFR